MGGCAPSGCCQFLIPIETGDKSMTRTGFWGLLCLVVCAGGAFAQTVQTGNVVFQQAGAIGFQTTTVEGFGTGGAKVMASGMFTPETVTGSPFSATDHSHSLQVLGDGTRIERT